MQILKKGKAKALSLWTVNDSIILFGNCELIISPIVSDCVWTPWSLTVWSAYMYHNESLASIYASNSRFIIEKKRNVKKHTLACFILSCQL